MATTVGGLLLAPTDAWAKKKPAKPRRRAKAPKIARERPVAWLKGNLPNVQAAGALAIDMDTGTDLYSKSGDVERPIASISKLAAVLVAMDKGLILDELTTITQTDADVAKGGAKSRLLTGMTVSNLDLLHAGLMGSDNRAISAMGRSLGLNAADFAKAMTKKAQALGLKHTRFREPTGLSRENVSTPRETILMLQTALAHPTLAPILGRLEYSAHPVSKPPIPYVNTYKPAMRRNAEILGGKTGFNDFARYCLVIAAKIDGRRTAMAFLGAEAKMTRFGDFARVADWLVMAKPHKKNETVASKQANPAAVGAHPDAEGVGANPGAPESPPAAAQ
ncbi:MAG: serine hydrolase [Deltaproteobacteria bacterium]|nr:serine hydrolase [Deltaproteobacteria bacterium]